MLCDAPNQIEQNKTSNTHTRRRQYYVYLKLMDWFFSVFFFVSFASINSSHSIWKKYQAFAVCGSTIGYRRCLHVCHRLYQSEWNAFRHMYRSLLLWIMLSAKGNGFNRILVFVLFLYFLSISNIFAFVWHTRMWINVAFISSFFIHTG